MTPTGENMLTPEENALLTLTGPGTDMGRVFRSYWQPALLSRELGAAGAQKRVKILGEDFIAFRDGSGAVGVIEPRYSHRGADLFFARNEAEDALPRWHHASGLRTRGFRCQPSGSGAKAEG